MHCCRLSNAEVQAAISSEPQVVKTTPEINQPMSQSCLFN
jgi:hypothetical protein